MADTNPARLIIEPTIFLGKISEAMVNTLDDQPWCAAVDNESITTAIHNFPATGMNRIDIIIKAQIIIAVFLA